MCSCQIVSVNPAWSSAAIHNLLILLNSHDMQWRKSPSLLTTRRHPLSRCRTDSVYFTNVSRQYLHSPMMRMKRCRSRRGGRPAFGRRNNSVPISVPLSPLLRGTVDRAALGKRLQHGGEFFQRIDAFYMIPLDGTLGHVGHVGVTWIVNKRQSV